MNPDAYVIADYLLTAGFRLQTQKPAILQATREILEFYPKGPETIAALAFLDAIEREREYRSDEPAELSS